jgi:glycosyltransferase involved in cell wall biosynthesis
MRILYFSPRNFWPLNSGGHLRDYYLARETARYASVSFLGICNPDESDKASANTQGRKLGLERLVLVEKGPSYTTGKILRGWIGPTPLTVLNYYDLKAARELSRILNEQTFDLVQIEQIHLIGYLPIIRACRSHPLVVCDWHNIESESMARYGRYTRNWAQKLYANRTTHLIKNMERRLLTECDAHIVVSERDQARLRTLVPEARVHIVENGVDMAQYADCEELDPKSMGAARSQQTRRDIVFVGSMDFHANIDGAKYFCAEVWPKIHTQAPQFRFIVVGSRPAAEVRDLAQSSGIIVTGAVDDVRPYYRGALAAIVPLRVGGGTRLKILEAMAAGVPVVSTSIGAEGLAVNPGANILLADTPEEMVRVLIELHHSPEMWRRLSEAGRELARTRYDWCVIGSSLQRTHRLLLDQRPHG